MDIAGGEKKLWPLYVYSAAAFLDKEDSIVYIF